MALVPSKPSEKIWVIGASDGIGAALVRAYAKQGAHLVISARNESALKTLAQEFPNIQVLPLDLAQPDAMASACAQFSLGHFDKIICTAAIYEPSAVVDLPPEAITNMVNVNLLGSFQVAQHAPALLRAQGQLVLFGSVAGYFGLPYGQPYSATKAAVNNLAESLRAELWPQTDVRLVCPGFVATRLTQKNGFHMPALITPEQAADAVIKGLQGKRFELHFPKRFTLLVKLISMLPYGISLRLSAKIARPKS